MPCCSSQAIVPRRLQDELHAARGDDARAMVDELGDVGDLGPGDVLSVGLTPFPPTPAAGPKFHILARAETMNLHDSPGEVLDDRRFWVFGHAIVSDYRVG